MAARRRKSARTRADRGPARKPAPKPFRKALDDLGNPVERAAMRERTPTRAGFSALKRDLQRVHLAQRTKGKPQLYSFRLKITYTDTRGRKQSVETDKAGFPLPRAVRKNRRRRESDTEAFNRMATREIQRAAFRQMKNAPGMPQSAGSDELVLEALKGSKAEARDALNAFKRQRNAKFQVIVEREL